jgi:hypothetical protein
MKKVILGVVLVLSLVAVFPRDASAAGPFNFYVRGGVLTDQDFTFSPFLWTIGANFDFNLGSALMLSPECDMIVNKFSFDPVWLAPAVTLNVRASGLYIGAGLGKFFLLGSGGTLSSDFLLKMNAGFKTDSIKLQVYAYTSFENVFTYMVYGATLGFGF